MTEFVIALSGCDRCAVGFICVAGYSEETTAVTDVRGYAIKEHVNCDSERNAVICCDVSCAGAVAGTRDHLCSD